jgi:predicted ATPase
VGSWNRVLNAIDRNDPDIESLRVMHLLEQLPQILDDLNFLCLETFTGINYIKPLRATGERFYRNQELAVDQIDPSGTNFAMFVSSLSDRESQRFSEWLLGIIGYEIKAEKNYGHVSLILKQRGSDKWFNIADMGFGFSQVLPILAQLWIQRYRRNRRRSRSSIVAVEQPELHLHPAMQSALADAFGRGIYTYDEESNKVGYSGQYSVIETHSEAFLERVGKLVRDNQIEADDVAIYLFDRDEEDEPTDVRSVSFDKDGALRNWPIGFFSWGQKGFSTYLVNLRISSPNGIMVQI